MGLNSSGKGALQRQGPAGVLERDLLIVSHTCAVKGQGGFKERSPGDGKGADGRIQVFEWAWQNLGLCRALQRLLIEDVPRKAFAEYR